jgi:hypothetical protein
VTNAAEAGEAGIGGEIVTPLAQWALDTLQCRTPTPNLAPVDVRPGVDRVLLFDQPALGRALGPKDLVVPARRVGRSDGYGGPSYSAPAGRSPLRTVPYAGAVSADPASSLCLDRDFL